MVTVGAAPDTTNSRVKPTGTVVRRKLVHATSSVNIGMYAEHFVQWIEKKLVLNLSVNSENLMNVTCLKDLPVEVDLGVESLGFIPDYSKYGFTGAPFDLRRITVDVEGYKITGLAEDGKLFIEMVQAPSRLNQKTLDAIEASDKEQE